MIVKDFTSRVAGSLPQVLAAAPLHRPTRPLVLWPKQGPRKKVPKELAVINADNCTGCESCLEVCPVDCIKLKKIDRGIVKGTQQWCEIDLERCVGCEVCVHIPGKKSNPYDLKVCPWDAIEMVPTEMVATVVAAGRRPAGVHPRELGPAGRHGPASGGASRRGLTLKASSGDKPSRLNVFGDSMTNKLPGIDP